MQKYKVIWSEKAHKKYNDNIAYLVKNWNDKVLLRFLDKVEERIFMLEKNPEIGSFDKKINANKLLIVRQIYLFYDIDRKNKRVELLTFWNNHKKPYWL